MIGLLDTKIVEIKGYTKSHYLVNDKYVLKEKVKIFQRLEEEPLDIEFLAKCIKHLNNDQLNFYREMEIKLYKAK
jgi:hypothetical protein